MSERKTHGKARDEHTNGASRSAPLVDSETKALNRSDEFQDLMAEGDREIREGRTRPAEAVFRRQRERRQIPAPR